jgi:small-conductance mechanosensitive channel
MFLRDYVWMIVLALLAVHQPALAQQPATPPAQAPATSQVGPEVTEPIERLSKSIESAEQAIQHLKELEEELSRLRGDVEGILVESTSAAEGLRPKLVEIKGLIEKLGPPPKAGEPPEAPAIAAERQRLNAMFAQLDGAIKSTELTWFRARQLIEKITVMRHAIFTRNLLERRQSPLLPGLWRDVTTRLPGVIERLAYYWVDWWSWASRKLDMLIGLLAGSIAAYFVLRVLVRKYDQRPPAPVSGPPSFFERAISVAWLAPLRLLPMAVAGLLLYAGIDGLDLLYSPWERPAAALLKSGLLLGGAYALFSTALAVKEPQWRLVPLSSRSAKRTLQMIIGVVAVYAADLALIEIGRAFFFPLTITVAQSFVANIAAAGFLALLVLSPLETQNGTPDTYEWQSLLTPKWLKFPLAVIAVAIVVASCLGYLALGRFMAQQLVLTGIVMVVAGLLYLAIRAVTRERTDGRHQIGDLLESQFGIDGTRRQQLARLAEFMLTFCLGLAVLPVIMLQWGFSGHDIRDWFKSLLFGFEIGQFRISLARILIGILIFTVLLFVTRLFQRWLREKVLAQPRMDSGIANSIDTAVGYGGIALAALISVSYAGFDITNLAIVAGALSVGIGFGLQSIVNNFVSGLILLVERPIKVGDWIVVGDQQGNVRRISVRSTEIETFDRASVIVPNSELIAGRVVNWTHRNLLGRVVLSVWAEPNADPDLVLAILTKAVKAHPLVLKSPEPLATLDSFGNDKLDFRIRATIGDVNQRGKVTSDLRVMILREFRKAHLLTPTIPADPPGQPDGQMVSGAESAPGQVVAPFSGTATQKA